MMSKKDTIISLFDLSGHWSQPYREAGYKVIQVDKALGLDVMEWDYRAAGDPGQVRGILMAPPCTHFTVTSAQYWPTYDEAGDTERSVALVRRALEIRDYFDDGNGFFWALENPPGRIEKVVPELFGCRMLMFEPWEYGDPYTKRSYLWGYFNPFLLRRYTKPMEYDGAEDWTKQLLIQYREKFPKYTRKQIRSITPMGFARAFYEANP